FHHGQEQGLSDQLVKAFNEQVVAGVVGKVTAETLQEAGVSRMVKPDRERMGAMIMAMDRFFKEKSTYI
ncbi:MAG TPA: uroporphyrinogen-III synthase, partial [Paenibacillaceae bacterium]|nr:uroporphyrinogen-III synthase [Paenibacillaceae bacterium]